MTIGDIHSFGTLYTKEASGKSTTQHTTTSAANNISGFTLCDTFNTGYTRQWVEADLYGKTIYIGTWTRPGEPAMQAHRSHCSMKS